MKGSTIGILALFLAVATAGFAEAAPRVVKKEPPMGALKPGEKVLVDDGSCGAGQIKEVVGGNHQKVGGTPGSTVLRRSRCIPR